MGAFKPLLPFGDKTVVETCVQNLFAGGVETVVVALGHRAHELHERIKHLPIRFALNQDPAGEMSASIARAVEQIPCGTDAVLVALADQPAIPPEIVRLLVEEQRRTGARLVVPEYQGRGGHPVLIHYSFRKELLTLNPQRGLRALFEAHRSEVLRVPVASPYVTRDMDTWDDYRSLYREVFGGEPPVTQP